MNLYKLVQEEHARERNRPTTNTQTYSISLPTITQDKRITKIWARYHNKSQRLLLVDIALKDLKPEQTFTDEEIKQLMSFVPNPKYFIIEDNHLKRFCLSFHRRILTSVNWYSKERFCQNGLLLKDTNGELQQIPYNDLAKMFGVNLNNRQFLYKHRFRDIDTSNIPDAYSWLINKFVSPRIVVLGNKRGIFIEGDVTPKTLENRFEIQIGLSGPVDFNYELSEEECKEVEQIVDSYRN